MSRLECDSCGDLVDVSWRTTTLPYICIRCEKDSALAIEQDVWETKYVGPACQQAAEEVHDLYGWKNHVAFQPSPLSVPYLEPIRGANGTQIGEIIRSGVPCQSALDNPPPCQSALDSVQEEQYLDPRVHAMHSGDILDQFDDDTELINGLMTENDDLKMKLSQANLNIQIQGEIIADLENTVGAYRVIFRIPGC